MELRQALEECRDLWTEMRDNEETDAHAKRKYLTTRQLGYVLQCPCCEYAKHELFKILSKPDCSQCPLLDLWGETDRDGYNCLHGENTPYDPFEYGKGTPEDADRIVQACIQKLEALDEHS